MSVTLGTKGLATRFAPFCAMRFAIAPSKAGLTPGKLGIEVGGGETRARFRSGDSELETQHEDF